MTKETRSPFEDERLNPFHHTKFPGMDMKGLLSIYRKNMEIMTSTQEITTETAQAVSELHNQYIKRMVDQWNDQLKHTFSKAPLEEKTSHQSENAKAAADRFIQYTQEVNSILTKSNEKLMESIQGRIKEGVNEAAEVAKKAQKSEK